MQITVPAPDVDPRHVAILRTADARGEVEASVAAPTATLRAMERRGLVGCTWRTEGALHTRGRRYLVAIVTDRGRAVVEGADAAAADAEPVAELVWCDRHNPAGTPVTARTAHPATDECAHPHGSGHYPPAPRRGLRFAHARQREQIPGVRCADSPAVVMIITRVTSTAVYFRRDDSPGSVGWHVARDRFATEAVGAWL